MSTCFEPAGTQRSTLPPESQTTIRTGEVHVWHGTLGAIPEPVSPAEEARARAMRSAPRRHEFLVCRGALRRILAGVLDVAPLAVPILEGAHGKPRLASGHSPPRRRPAVGFNMSHSGERFVVAVAFGMEPGVDVERIRPRRSLARLTRRFFSPAEQRAVAFASDPLDAFYRVWARKEAVIKADGRGVSIGLGRFDVTAGESPDLLEARWEGAAPNEASHWSLHSLKSGPGYAAALAVRSRAAEVVVRTGIPGPNPPRGRSGLRAGPDDEGTRPHSGSHGPERPVHEGVARRPETGPEPGSSPAGARSTAVRNG